MLPVNDNTMHLERYRGTVRRCPHCNLSSRSKDKSDAIAADRMALGRACGTCLGRGFVADCLNCEATGMYKGSAAAFGGGDHLHASTCNYCGGTGMFAVNRPADWKDEPPAPAEESVAPAPAAV